MMLKVLVAVAIFANTAFAQERSIYITKEYSLLSSNTILYVSMFKYMVMDDAELKQQVKVFLTNVTKKDANVDSKEFVLERYKPIHKKVVGELIRVKSEKDNYSAYEKKIYFLKDNGMLDVYMATTEYLYRNFNEDLITQFKDYDALELRTDYGFMVGFLGDDPTKTNKRRESAGIKLLYEPVIRKLIDEKINPATFFSKDVVSILKEVAEGSGYKESFIELSNIDNNKDPKILAEYSITRIEEILTSGNVTFGDIEALRIYAQDMIDAGDINNAVLALSALKNSKESVVELEESLKLKEGTIVSQIYYDASTITIDAAIIKYLELDNKILTKYERVKYFYKGLEDISYKINSSNPIKREYAEFLNSAVLPFLFTQIDAMTEELKEPSIKKNAAKKLEGRLLAYILGANIYSEVLLAAPRLVTNGLSYFSPYKVALRRDAAFEQVKDVIKDKAAFESMMGIKGYEATVKFRNEMKEILFIKGY